MGAVLVAGALAGCGSAGGGATSDSRTPVDVARDYVAALSKKDGRRFCDDVAPYLKDTFRLAVEQTYGDEETVKKHVGMSGCAAFVTVFTGYLDDGGVGWKSAAILSAGPAIAHGDLMAVPMELRHRWADEREPKTTTEFRRGHDVVYLARFHGGWKVAKLSQVAHDAGFGFDDESEPTAPPDLAAEQRRYDKLRGKQDARDVAAEDAYRQAGPLASCKGEPTRAVDRTGDQEDQSGHGRRHVNRPGSDIRSVTVSTSGDTLCGTVELAAAPSGVVAIEFLVRDAGAPQAYLSQIAIERGSDGRWRATNGRSDDDVRYVDDVKIGVSGTRVSVVFPRSALEYEPPPFSDFAWSVATVESIDDGSVADHAPSSGLNVRYPDGELCAEQGASEGPAC